MTAEIVELEEVFNDLLPGRRLERQPSNELLAIASRWSEAVWAAGESLGAIAVSSQQREAASQLSQRPVFICGVHRSGTTLVRDLLDGHPALTVLPSEGSYLTSLEPRIRQMSHKKYQSFLGQEWLRRLANPINQPPYWLLGRSTAVSSPYVHFVRNFITWQAVTDKRLYRQAAFNPLIAVVLSYAAAGGEITATQWVDKTPTNERFLKKIWSQLPEARIIQVIRDPVAVMVSRKRMEPALNLRAFLRDITGSFRVAYEQSRIADSRYLLLRYEELCAEPESIIKRLSGFLGIDMEPSLLQPTVARTFSAANSSFTRNAPEGRILSANEHTPAELISMADKELLSAHLGGLASQLGYPMQHVDILKARFLKIKSLLNAG